jgi:hypothetical protein
MAKSGLRQRLRIAPLPHMRIGKPSTEHADWIQKVIARRVRDYRFAVEAVEPVVPESPA